MEALAGVRAAISGTAHKRAATGCSMDSQGAALPPPGNQRPLEDRNSLLGGRVSGLFGLGFGFRRGLGF
jgi:hypothetical protein